MIVNLTIASLRGWKVQMEYPVFLVDLIRGVIMVPQMDATGAKRCQFLCGSMVQPTTVRHL